MDKQRTLERVGELGLLAVLRGPSAELTLDMVDVLVANGVLGIEITYTTPNAPEIVATLGRKYGDQILLGLGTLTELEHVIQAQAAGARFIVSPHCERVLAGLMVSSRLVTMIGVLTPSEVIKAYRLGADVVKIFPGSLGGPGYLKGLRGPFPHIRMIPTGGVSVENVADWFAAGAMAVGAGSDLCPPAWAKAGRFDEIGVRAREFVDAVANARAK